MEVVTSEVRAGESIQTAGYASLPRRVAERVASALPRGGSLPEESWRRRHHAILVLLWGHVAAIPVFALIRGYGTAHSLVEAVPLAAFALLAVLLRRGRKLRSAMAAFGLLTASAVLVHLSGGSIEMHFHFFVMMGVLTLYEDWLPFLLAVGYVAVHHGLLGTLDPGSVYNHAAAWAHPWTWAAIHAAFVLSASAVYVGAWRINEEARAKTVESYRRLQESETTLKKTDADRRQLLEGLVRAAEDERVRIAAELHDSSIQNLTALDYKLETAGLLRGPDDPERASNALRSVQDALRREIDGLRTMMSELRPPVLDERGLEAALSDYATTIRERSGVDCSVETRCAERLDPAQEIVLYRVAQEALTNVTRHASAQRAWLSLHTDNGTVVLEVGDDGVGFDPAHAGEIGGKDHFGLMAMRERISMLGGTFEVESGSGAGTRIRAVVPRREVVT